MPCTAVRVNVHDTRVDKLTYLGNLHRISHFAKSLGSLLCNLRHPAVARDLL